VKKITCNIIPSTFFGNQRMGDSLEISKKFQGLKPGNPMDFSG